MSNFKMIVVVGFVLKFKTLLDTKTKINGMIHQIMENAGFAMRKNPNLKLISHNGEITMFMNLCENVEIETGNLIIIHFIFVIFHAIHVLVFDQFFLMKIRFIQSYDKNII